MLIDAVNPVYGAADPPLPLRYDAEYTQNRHGFYFQDLLSLGRHWKAMLGVRYDRVHTKFDRVFTPLFPRVRNDQNFDRVSPRVGLVYQPIPDVLTYYGSYSESFDLPPGGPRADPTPLEPELGQIWEGGVKAELLDGLSMTVSGFHILKQDVIVDDLTTFVTTQVGEIRSQGCEMALVGELTDRWTILANYAYVDARITEDSVAGRVGQRFRNVPYNSANLWTRYDLLQRRCETLGVALGMVHVGDRTGDVDGTFLLPSYTRWDSGVYYRRGRLSATVYLENLFDIEYYTSSESAMAVFPGAPFNLRGTVAVVY
jgi:iron complex outermembrane receptor protein